MILEPFRKLQILMIGGLLLWVGVGCFPYNTDCSPSDLGCNFGAAALYLTLSSTPPCGGAGLSAATTHSYLSSGSVTQGGDICALRSGGLVAVGRGNAGVALQGRSPLLPFSGASENSLIVKWDSGGAVEWFTYISTTTSPITITKIAETNDGGLILLGSMGSPANVSLGGLSPIMPGVSGDDTDIFVARLRADGGLAWHTALGGGGASDELSAAGVTVARDGSVYLVGAANAGVPSTMGSVAARTPFAVGDSTNLLIAKLAASGELLWYRYAGGGTGASYSAAGIAETTDGGLIVGGFAQNTLSNTIDGLTAILPFSAGDDRNALALKLDPEGDLLWFTYLGGGGPGSSYHTNGVVASSDGSAVLNGAAVAGQSTIGGVTALIPYTPGANAYGLVWKLNSFGALQWFTYLGGGGGLHDFTSIKPTPDGGLLVAGQSQGGGNVFGSVSAIAPHSMATMAALVARLSASGNLEWFTYFGEGDQHYLNGLAVAADGGPIAIGYSRLPTSTIQGKPPLNPFNAGDSDNLFLLKLDRQGKF